MEQILLPLGVATEAAFDALKLHSGPDHLSPAVAEIVSPRRQLSPPELAHGRLLR